MTLDLTTPLGMTLGLLPEVLLTLFAMAALLVGAWRHDSGADSRRAGWVSLAGVAAAGAALLYLWGNAVPSPAAAAMVTLDGFRFVGQGIILIATGGTILLSLAYLEREDLLAPEYYPLVLFAATGMLLLASATDLMVLFLGLEVMSVAVYVLAGFDRTNRFSSEAALKYFLIGAFASAFLLYGIALLYGGTGTTVLEGIGAVAVHPLPRMAALGLGFLIIGFGFKIAAAPFHMWAPDVYDGAPTPVAGFMATGVKAAGFTALARVLFVGLAGAAAVWVPIVAVLSALSMILGNLVALVQRSVKRMLAYSSIAHAGYLLVALAAGGRLGLGAMLTYLFAYALTTLAAFGLLGVLGRRGERDVTLDTIAGLARTRPGIAAALALCMLSLLGFPGTFGFMGKWAILTAATGAGQNALAVLLVVTSIVSAGFYLPVIMAMYMKAPAGEAAHEEVWLSPPAAATVAFAVALVVVFGLWPAPALETAAEGARALSARVQALGFGSP